MSSHFVCSVRKIIKIISHYLTKHKWVLEFITQKIKGFKVYSNSETLDFTILQSRGLEPLPRNPD